MAIIEKLLLKNKPSRIIYGQSSDDQSEQDSLVGLIIDSEHAEQIVNRFNQADQLEEKLEEANDRYQKLLTASSQRADQLRQKQAEQIMQIVEQEEEDIARLKQSIKDCLTSQDTAYHNPEYLELIEENETLKKNLQAINQGAPFSDCAADCGRNGIYCCSGDWDLKNKIKRLEFERDQLAEEAVVAAATRLMRKYDYPQSVAEVITGAAVEIDKLENKQADSRLRKEDQIVVEESIYDFREHLNNVIARRREEGKNICSDDVAEIVKLSAISEEQGEVSLALQENDQQQLAYELRDLAVAALLWAHSVGK